MDHLVAVGEVEVPHHLAARVRRILRHSGDEPATGLVANLRSNLARRVLVVGVGEETGRLAGELREHGLPVVVYTDDDVALGEGIEKRWLTDPNGPMDVADDLLDLVGNTPMMRLDRTGRDLDCHLLAKLELFNPGFSSKDRPALAMVEAAEREGLLKPGGIIVEPTSGNTGVGLAIVAARRGYHCVFVCPDKVATDKIAQLRAYGAEVIVCPTAVEPDHPDSYYSVSDRLVRERPNAWKPDQYHNPNNPQAQYDTAGPEIWEQTKGRITHFVCGVGTGGTISGIGRYLKEQNPDIRIIGADPEGSVYSGGTGRPYLVEGIGEDFWPSTYDPTIPDEIIAISDAESFATARRVTRQEGLLVGGSAGTAIAAALRVGRGLPQDAVVVVHIPDSGRGYLTKLYDDAWMADHGFLRASGPLVAELLESRDPDLPLLVHTHPEETVRTAIDIMREFGVSQLPVVKAEPPVVLGEVVGSVTEVGLLDRVMQDPGLLERPVAEVVGPPLPTLGLGEPLNAAVEMLRTATAALVLDAGHPVGVISRADILSQLSDDREARR